MTVLEVIGVGLLISDRLPVFPPGTDFAFTIAQNRTMVATVKSLHLQGGGRSSRAAPLGSGLPPPSRAGASLTLTAFSRAVSDAL